MKVKKGIPQLKWLKSIRKPVCPPSAAHKGSKKTKLNAMNKRIDRGLME